MTGRRIVLVRHGRTAWNDEGRQQGHTDTELDGHGHEQASVAAPLLVARYAPSMLWSSDLARARQTTAYVASAAGLDATYDARLREFDLGERTGLTLAEFAERHPEQHAAHVAGRYEPVAGGETVEEVTARVREALVDVLGLLAAGETAMVVGHGTSLKASVAALLGWPASLTASLGALGNCHQAVLQEVEHGERLRLLAWNVPA